jgi:hypothetical protein
VTAVAEFFRDLQAAGRSEATLRSYGHDLLRWFRFLWAVQIPWARATRIEARDFCRWMLVAGKPARPRWRRSGRAGEVGAAGGQPYAPSVRAHCETVLRRFYELEQWMTVAAASGEPALKSFVTGLRADQDAVTAGLTPRWSSGCVKGHVNRIILRNKFV